MSKDDRDFNHAYIIAVSNTYFHGGGETACRAALLDAGITYEDTLTHDLTEMDAHNMVRIFWHGGLDESLGGGMMSASEYLDALEG